MLWTDMRTTLRSLVKHPFFALTSITTLGLGIGANTTIFSLVNAVMLRPLPGIEAPAKLVELLPRAQGETSAFSYPDFLDIRERSRNLDDLVAFEYAMVTLGGSGNARPLWAMTAAGNYFSVLGTQPAAGRFFLPEESFHPGVPPVAVISYSLWQRSFGGEPDVIGKVLILNSQPTTVIGVAPGGFQGHAVAPSVDLWLPLGMIAPGLSSAATLEGREHAQFSAIGRIATGADAETVARELTGFQAQLQSDDGRERLPVEVEALGTLPSVARLPVAGFLAVLVLIVSLVMLIACVNVAGLLLARGLSRTQEIAVRLALGASRRRLIRSLVAESLVLFILAGLAGALIAVVGTRLLMTFKPPMPPPVEIDLDLSLDLRVLAFTLLLSLLTGLVSGLVPALRTTRPDLVSALKNESRAETPGTTRLRSFLTGAQVAVTLVLLVVAGLFLRALVQAQHVDPGFTVENIHVASIDLEPRGYSEQQGWNYLQSLLERLRALPGVESASLAKKPPLASATFFGGINVEGFDPPPNGWFQAYYNVVTPGYFQTLDIPLIAGRELTEADTETAPYVAVVNRTMAERFWPGENAVGRRFFLGGLGSGIPFEIVGVARDANYHSLREEAPAFIYLSFPQWYQSGVTVHVRARPGWDAANALRAIMQELDPTVPLLSVSSLRENMGRVYVPHRVVGSAAGLLGIVGLILAAVGVYSIATFTVTQRLHQIGVRMALGAGRREIFRWVVRKAMRAPAIGMAGGMVIAMGLSFVISMGPFGIRSADPLIFVGVGTMLATVALVAALLPARRAATIEPMSVLRGE
jgi:predicted permease